jgi:hypothetical protein
MCVTNDHDDLVNCYRVCVSQMTMMIWLTVTEYVFHKWPWICSVCRPCNQVLSSLMTHHWVCNESNMMDATYGAGSVYPSRTLEFTPSFEWGTCCSISSFLCNVFLDHCLSGISLLSFFFWSLQSMFDHCSLCLITAVYVWSLQSMFDHCSLCLITAVYVWSLQSMFDHCSLCLIIAVCVWSLQSVFDHCSLCLIIAVYANFVFDKLAQTAF